MIKTTTRRLEANNVSLRLFFPVEFGRRNGIHSIHFLQMGKGEQKVSR